MNGTSNFDYFFRCVSRFHLSIVASLPYYDAIFACGVDRSCTDYEHNFAIRSHVSMLLELLQDQSVQIKSYRFMLLETLL